MNITGSIEINRPIEEVFDYTNHSVEQWSLTVVEDRPTNSIEGKGATFFCATQERGCRMEFDGVVTQWDPPNRSVVEMIGKNFDLRIEYRFQEIRGRTRVSQSSAANMKGFMKIVMYFIGWLMARQSARAVDQELQSLKQKMENG
ncbi:SRPBCC family protein [Rubripirellula sp.]|nr:SRPBCC family protein [Rubripirellula sp.]MDB4338906.1 SRPBCC family protein [Rubripirellula sp.]